MNSMHTDIQNSSTVHMQFGKFVSGPRRAVFREISRPAPSYIAATGDNHLFITSYSNNVVVYTLGGQVVHEVE